MQPVDLQSLFMQSDVSRPNGIFSHSGVAGLVAAIRAVGKLDGCPCRVRRRSRRAVTPPSRTEAAAWNSRGLSMSPHVNGIELNALAGRERAWLRIRCLARLVRRRDRVGQAASHRPFGGDDASGQG